MPAKPPSKGRRSDPVTAYADDVAEGRIVAGPLVRLACERHLLDLEQGPSRGLRWSLTAARRALGFFPDVLRLHEGEHAGKPFVLAPSQEFIVGSLFGWLNDTGHRRFRTAYVEEGKGNGKSPLAAGIGLFGLAADNEPGAQIYSAAVTRDQAGLLFADADSMVAQSPALSARLTRTVNNIAYLKTGSYFRPLSSEARSLDGKRVHMGLVDEIHEHKTPLVWRKIRAGLKGRRQPLMLGITNSGWDRKTICWELHEYVRKIVERLLENDSAFGFVCGLDKNDDWRDEAVWAKANPLLDVSITRQYLREQVAEAEGMPSSEALVQRLNFCIWTESITQAFEREGWEACARPVDRSALRGRPCHGGLDLSGKGDLTALVLVFPREGGGYDVLPFFWVPETGIAERVAREGVPYDLWIRQGLVTATPGKSVDYAYVAKRLGELAAEFDIKAIGFDPYRIGDLERELDAEGVELVLEKHGQGFISMGLAFDDLEKEIVNQRLRHGANPVLNMCAANAVVVQDAAGNRKFAKDKSQGRIDGVVALAMAVRMAKLPRPEAEISLERAILERGGFA